ncbi:MAG TPA: VanZ family protein [Anaeromyxobacteraceae bacterium]|nr:VanZ family protein [Anaeromyxobacteraceae bacterium]
MSRRWLGACAPPILYAALIFGLSSLSSPQDLLPQELLGFDKALHLGEYAALGALLARALSGGDRSPARAFLWALLLGAIYGVSDELHQALVPGRDASAFDWIADAAGTGLGAAAFLFLRRRGRAD